MSEKCPHFVTDEGKCITCGESCDNPRWTIEGPEKFVREIYQETSVKEQFFPDLGNIPGICQLAQATWEEYDQRATANETPNQPQMPRLQMIGGRLMRIPFHQIWREVVSPAYLKAKELGYLGTYQRWEELVKESQPHHN